MTNTNTLAPVHDLLVPPHTGQPESKGESEDAESNFYKIPLRPGEIYVGCIGDAAGNLHHVILLPGDNDDATWEAQMEWAKSIGGDLPTRIEQVMLWTNHRDQFKKDWYWSGEQYHCEPEWAWCQYFDSGGQYYYYRGAERRARAVRRVVQRNPLLVLA